VLRFAYKYKRVFNKAQVYALKLLEPKLLLAAMAFYMRKLCFKIA